VDVEHPDVPTPKFRDAVVEMLEWLIGSLRVVERDDDTMVATLRLAESDLARANELVGIYRGKRGPNPVEVAAATRLSLPRLGIGRRRMA
jgi:hypothetical protein